jgi:hypothetical protein
MGSITTVLKHEAELFIENFMIEGDFPKPISDEII